MVEKNTVLERNEQTHGPQRKLESNRRSAMDSPQRNTNRKMSLKNTKADNMQKNAEKSGTNGDQNDKSSTLTRKQETEEKRGCGEQELPNERSVNLKEETKGPIVTRRKRSRGRRGKGNMKHGNSMSRIHPAASKDSSVETGYPTEKSKDNNGETPFERATQEFDDEKNCSTTENDKKCDETGSNTTTEKHSDGNNKNIGEESQKTWSKGSCGPSDGIKNRIGEAENQKSIQGIENVKNCPKYKNGANGSGEKCQKATARDSVIGNGGPTDGVKSRNEDRKSQKSSENLGGIKISMGCKSINKDVGGRSFGSERQCVRREKDNKTNKTEVHTAIGRKSASSRNNVGDSKHTSNPNESDFSQKYAVGVSESKTKSESQKSVRPCSEMICLTDRCSIKDNQLDSNKGDERRSSEGSIGIENRTTISMYFNGKMEDASDNTNYNSGSNNNNNKNSNESIDCNNNKNDETETQTHSSSNNKRNEKKSPYWNIAARHDSYRVMRNEGERGRTYRDRAKYTRKPGELANRLRAISPSRNSVRDSSPTSRGCRNLGEVMSTESNRSPKSNSTDNSPTSRNSRKLGGAMVTKLNQSRKENCVKDISPMSRDSRNLDGRTRNDSTLSGSRNSRDSSPRNKDSKDFSGRMSTKSNHSPNRQPIRDSFPVSSDGGNLVGRTESETICSPNRKPERGSSPRRDSKDFGGRMSNEQKHSTNRNPVRGGSPVRRDMDDRKGSESIRSRNRNSRDSSPSCRNSREFGGRMRTESKRSPIYYFDRAGKRGLETTALENVPPKRRCVGDTVSQNKMNPKRCTRNKDLRVMLVDKQFGKSNTLLTGEKISVTDNIPHPSDHDNLRKESNLKDSTTMKKGNENGCSMSKILRDKNQNGSDGTVPLTRDLFRIFDTKMDSSKNMDDKGPVVAKSCSESSSRNRNGSINLEKIPIAVDKLNNSDILLDSSKNLEEKANYINQKSCDLIEEKVWKNFDTPKDFSTRTNPEGHNLDGNEPGAKKTTLEDNNVHEVEEPLKNSDILKGSLTGRNLEDSESSSTFVFTAVKNNIRIDGLGFGKEQRIECTMNDTFNDSLSKDDKEKIDNNYNGRGKLTCPTPNTDGLVDGNQKSIELEAKESKQIRNERFDLERNDKGFVNVSVFTTASDSKTNSDTESNQLENDKKSQFQSLLTPNVPVNETLKDDLATKKVLLNEEQVEAKSENITSKKTTLSNQKGAGLANNKLILAKLKRLKNARKALRNLNEPSKVTAVDAKTTSIETKSNGKQRINEDGSRRLLTTGNVNASECKSLEVEHGVVKSVESKISIVSNCNACEKNATDQKCVADIGQNKPVPAVIEILDLIKDSSNAIHKSTDEGHLEIQRGSATKADGRFRSISSENCIGFTSSKIRPEKGRATPNISSCSMPENSHIDAVKSAEEAEVAMVKVFETPKHPSSLKQDYILSGQETNQIQTPAEPVAIKVSQKLLNVSNEQDNNGVSCAEALDSTVATSNGLQTKTSTAPSICASSQDLLNCKSQEERSSDDAKNAEQPSKGPKSVVPYSNCKQDNGLHTKEKSLLPTLAELTNVLNRPGENKTEFHDARIANHTKDMPTIFVNNKNSSVGKDALKLIKVEENKSQTSIGQTNAHHSFRKNETWIDHAKSSNRMMNAPKSCVHLKTSPVCKELDDLHEKEGNNQSQISTQQKNACDPRCENGARFDNGMDMANITCDKNSSVCKQDHSFHRKEQNKSQTSIEQINSTDRLAEKKDRFSNSKTANDANASEDIQTNLISSKNSSDCMQDNYRQENKDSQIQTLAGHTNDSDHIQRLVGNRRGLNSIDISITDTLSASETEQVKELKESDQFSKGLGSKFESGDRIAEANEIIDSSSESKFIAIGVDEFTEKSPLRATATTIVAAEEGKISKSDETVTKDSILGLTESKVMGHIVKNNSASTNDLQSFKKYNVEQSKVASSTAKSNVSGLKHVIQLQNDEALAKGNTFDHNESNTPENTERKGLGKPVKDKFDLRSNAFNSSKEKLLNNSICDSSDTSKSGLPISENLALTNIPSSGSDIQQVESLKIERPSAKDGLLVKESRHENVLGKPNCDSTSSTFPILENSSSASNSKSVSDFERENIFNTEELLKKLRKHGEEYSSEKRSDFQKTGGSSKLNLSTINCCGVYSRSTDSTVAVSVSSHGSAVSSCNLSLNDNFKHINKAKSESKKLSDGDMLDVSKKKLNVVDGRFQALLNSGVVNRKPMASLSAPVKIHEVETLTNTHGLLQRNVPGLMRMKSMYNSSINLGNHCLANPATGLQCHAQNIGQLTVANVQSVSQGNQGKKKKKARRKESKNQRKKRLRRMQNQQSAQQGNSVNTQNGKGFGNNGNVNNTGTQDSRVDCLGMKSGRNYVQRGKRVGNNCDNANNNICTQDLQGNSQGMNNGEKFVPSGTGLGNKGNGRKLSQSTPAVLNEIFQSEVMNNGSYSFQFQIGDGLSQDNAGRELSFSSQSIQEVLSEASHCDREGQNDGEYSVQNAKGFSLKNNEETKFSCPTQSSQDSCLGKDIDESIVQSKNEFSQDDKERTLEHASENSQSVLKQAAEIDGHGFNNGENSVQSGKPLIHHDNGNTWNNRQSSHEVLKQAFQIDSHAFNVANSGEIGSNSGNLTEDTGFVGKRKREDEASVSGNKHHKNDNQMENICLNQVQNNDGNSQAMGDQSAKISKKERLWQHEEKRRVTKKLTALRQQYNRDSDALLKSVKILARADPSLTEKLKCALKEGLAEIGRNLIGELHPLKVKNDQIWNQLMMAKGNVTIQNNSKNRQKRSVKNNVPQNNAKKKQNSARNLPQNKPQKQQTMGKNNAAQSKPKNPRHNGAFANQWL